MQKFIFFSLFLLLTVSVFAQDTGREATVESFTEIVNKDTLVMVGDDIGNVFNNFTDEIRSKPPTGILGWLMAVLSLLASLFGALRKYWPFLSRTFKNAKGDTVVIIFALVGGLVWSGFDLQITGEELYLKTASVFTTAVLFYKIGLGKLWDRIFKKKQDPAPVAGR